MDAVIAAGGRSATTTGSGSTGRGSWRPSLGEAALVCSKSLKNTLDPRGDPQPRKARASFAVRRGRLALTMGILVVDVGSSSVRASVVEPDGTVDHVQSEPVVVVDARAVFRRG